MTNLKKMEMEHNTQMMQESKVLARVDPKRYNVGIQLARRMEGVHWAFYVNIRYLPQIRAIVWLDFDRGRFFCDFGVAFERLSCPCPDFEDFLLHRQVCYKRMSDQGGTIGNKIVWRRIGNIRRFAQHADSGREKKIIFLRLFVHKAHASSRVDAVADVDLWNRPLAFAWTRLAPSRGEDSGRKRHLRARCKVQQHSRNNMF